MKYACGVSLLRSMLSVVVLMLSACASFPNQKPIDQVARKSVTNVAVVSATEPTKLEMINTKSPGMFFGLVGGLIEQSASSNRSAAIMGKSGGQLQAGRILTDSLVQALRSKSIEAQTVARPQAQPISDYRALSLGGEQAVLDASIERIGFISLIGSGGYVPVLQVKARLLKPNSNDVLWANQFSYGLEGAKDFYVNLPYDPRYSFATFEDLSARSAEAIEALNVGAQAIAQRIAEMPN